MGLVIQASYWLLKHSPDRLWQTLGIVALSAALAELSAGIAGSSFFPTQSMVPYLCVWGVALRVYHLTTAVPADSPLSHILTGLKRVAVPS
jgi:hypothetical protein